MKSWTTLTLRFPRTLEEQILLALQEAGSIGIQVHDEGSPARTCPPEDSPGARRAKGAARPGAGSIRARREAVGVAYFEPGADLEPLTRTLDRISGGLVLDRSETADEPWAERQEASRRAIDIGKRFRIVPHVPGPAERGASGQRIVLTIPPRRAFGTGEHETTRQCLEMLDSLSVEGKRVLDVGTGSGILAMAALRLGALRVVGVDNDPEAIEIAQENLILNGMEGRKERIHFLIGDLASLSGAFDLVLANLFVGLLEASSSRLAALQQAGGRLILSGFAPSEAEPLARLYRASGYTEITRSEAGDWAALLLERHPDKPRAQAAGGRTE